MIFGTHPAHLNPNAEMESGGQFSSFQLLLLVTVYHVARRPPRQERQSLFSFSALAAFCLPRVRHHTSISSACLYVPGPAPVIDV